MWLQSQDDATRGKSLEKVYINADCLDHSSSITQLSSGFLNSLRVGRKYLSLCRSDDRNYDNDDDDRDDKTDDDAHLESI